ncbi:MULTISPECIES: hypothetical protein [Mycobacterium]|uniref:hypothetical protein n=1 Tax=Mycobacterium TaxID=1763 RepID=UPI0011540DBA|nr:hypothetical protein [Mycobacterium paraseoulense]MCV7397962.1 hypothetical protein [Mycobacterium paraseoulense]BBZ70301.1 hypothetical protein MPRS_13940 [Mycobacterium paraseoulense]
MIRRRNRAAIVGQSPAVGTLITAHRLWIAMLWMLFIASVSAVFVTAALGQVLTAMIIGLITGAFFAGMAS